MNKQDLIPLVEKVAELREHGKNMIREQEQFWDKIKGSPEGREYEGMCIRTGAVFNNLEIAERELKERALVFYEETKEKKPVDKVEIKIFKRLKYDATEVLAWCKRNSPALLIVNKKPFEKAAVEIGAPVEVTEEAKCTIGTDLSAYIKTKEEVKTDG